MKRGFTLIETVIYIALLGLIMSGAVMMSYQLLQGSGSTSARSTVQDEGGFVLRKLSWALSGATDISGGGSALTVTRADGNTTYLRLNGNVIEIRENATGANYEPITTEKNVQASALQFVVAGSNPKSLNATFKIKTANGTDAPLPFSFKRYLRI